ncbi:MAG: pyridoxal-phosphate dependent enzyme [Myxococcota bacterium]|nr:pyridoxal-phosphate dependent enzyme [Myxococcota bacterium]
MSVDRPIFDRLPGFDAPWEPLGDFPTPVEPMRETGARLGAPDALWIKRDDLSSPVYGGNKVRTLEALFGLAKARGAARVYSTGAYGSNHATATVLHAPRAGLEPGVILFPQPKSHAAVENLRVMLSRRPALRALPHWSFLPLGMQWQALQDRRAGIEAFQMVPGGATPEGALGYVSAALELALQVEAGEAPRPRQVLLGVGSTCTSAGLLLGLRIAAALGIGWKTPPRIVSVRVTPWPVTSAFRIVGLAVRTGQLLARITGERRWGRSRAELAAGLEVDGGQLGLGYGRPTARGVEAIRWVREAEGLELDTTYSAKAFAAALARARAHAARTDEPGPLLYWSTKSTAPLPEVDEADWRWAPRAMTRWIERAQKKPRA